MRKIAIVAVAFALIGAVANIHMAAAQAAQQVNQNPAVSTTLTTKTVVQQPAAQQTAPSPVVITVQHGDTLKGIAAANGTTYMRLFDANSFINNPDLIFPGQQITVPASNEQLPDRAVPAPAPAPQAVAPAPVATPTAAPVAKSVPAPVVTPAPTPAPAATLTAAPVASSSDASAKAYIYAHESGSNPSATNPEGCYGLGQDCSGKVRALCGANYACQDAWFTSYASSRYGGWANAEAFWQAHHWW